ncbi:glycosyltransferase [Isoptericola sp. b441]|uniref:Glycosyltransferase n=1 Tax=Actinotalea lenta TaxID=3064654 RepID=A0ABT9D7H0_9CELL|nr:MULTISPECIES: glycosyltransferase family 2 protein [unclassified Isoptericola]MDO8106807.1 glycosyltransferase [Isoptericola sp. b441]MDO8121482.1 glycosyltransferase [Isoptericola sp. b490]
MSRLTVAVLTYLRPADLAAVVPMLVEQVAEVGGGSVLVVDNDPDCGAREQVAAFGSGVCYVHEPAPGIAAARNRALEEADADLVVFIDDDERPRPGWLAALLATYQASRPAAVVGPVVSEYEVEPEQWVRDGHFFDRRRLPTGTEIDVAATNNLLLDLTQVGDLRFDVRFGLSGGSDTLFSRALVRAGGRMVWCDEAIVVDVVPAARATRRWVVRRAFRSGNSWSRTSLALADSSAEAWRARAACTGRGVIRCAGGAARWVAGVLTGSRPLRARGVRTVMRGSGMLAGAWGATYVEYKR